MIPPTGLSVFAAAAEAPDRPALVAEGRTWTWRALAVEAGRAIAWLRGRGLPELAPVALVAANDTRTLAMLHACIAAGQPVHLLDPRWSTMERERVLGQAGDLPVIDPALGDVWPQPDPPPPPPPDDEAILAVVYTSGSTAAPRGALLSRRAFRASAEASAANLGWRDDDRWLLRLPVSHVGGLSILTRCLLARRCVVVAGPEAAGPAGLARTVEAERVTLLSLVPTLLRRMLDLQPAWDPPPHLRAILLGGAPASARLLGDAADRRWPVLTTYGMTETCSQVATQPTGTVNRGQLGAGRPLEGVELRIAVEPAGTGQAAEPGETTQPARAVDVGEIEVRGPMLFSGYVGEAGADSGHLTADGWLATGDLGRIDADGFLHVTGRATAMIISGGENVSPVAVEAVLREHPAVGEAVVFGVPDLEWGERVCAAVVIAPGSDLAAATVAEYVRNRLGPAARPRRLAILDELPRTSAGKLDRREARERALPLLRDLG